jgi:hypothetical protein
MLNDAGTFSNQSAAVEADVVNRQAPAVLTSILLHMLALLVLPLLELPDFRHRVANELASITATQADFGDLPSSQFALSPTLPADPVTTVAQQFAATPPNLISAGGQSAGLQVVESDTALALPGLILLPERQDVAQGPSAFDPAGTLDSLPAVSEPGLPLDDDGSTTTTADAAADVNQEQSPAIAAALQWIVSQQTHEGYWQTERSLVFDEQGKLAHHERVSATSLALLPLIAMQQTHERGKYAQQVQAAVNFLLTAETDLVGSDSEAQRALALAELFIQTRDARVRAGAQQAIEKVLANDYRPLLGQGEDTLSRRTRYYGPSTGVGTRYSRGSTLAWQIFAMRAGELAGLQVNTNVIPTLRYYANTPVASAYSSVDRRGSYLRAEGAKLADAGCAKNGEHMREKDYFTTLLLARCGHADNAAWQKKTTEHLLATQNKLFPHTGSWTALSKSEDDLTATIFATLILCAPSESLVIHRKP